MIPLSCRNRMPCLGFLLNCSVAAKISCGGRRNGGMEGRGREGGREGDMRVRREGGREERREEDRSEERREGRG